MSGPQRNERVSVEYGAIGLDGSERQEEQRQQEDQGNDNDHPLVQVWATRGRRDRERGKQEEE